MNIIPKDDLEHISMHLSNELEKLRNKTILITGATGFFGKWLLGSLIFMNQKYDTKIEILAVSRDPNKFIKNYPELASNSITFIQGDLKDIKISLNVDYIIHAGMDVKLNLNSKSDDVVHNEQIIIDNILDIYHSTNCKKLLFTSSGAFYDKRFYDEPRPSEDLHPTQYSTLYGKAKSISENRIISSNINYSIARCFTFIGPHLPLDASFAAGNFINSILKNQDIQINGNGTPVRSFLYMSDLVIYLIKLLTLSSNQIVNVGSDEEISILDLAKEVAKFGSETGIEVKSDSHSDRISCYSPNIFKLEKLFNHKKDHINLRSGLEKTINFYKKREA